MTVQMEDMNGNRLVNISDGSSDTDVASMGQMKTMGGYYADGVMYKASNKVAFKKAVVGTAGQITCYLTDDGTISGNSLIPLGNFLDHFFNAIVNDKNNQYQFAWSLSGITLSVTVYKISSILGVLTLGNPAPAGTIASISVVCS